MDSKLFRVNGRDLLRGLVSAVIVAVIASVSTGIQGNGVDWRLVLEVAVLAGLGYLGTVFSSNETGKVLGKI